MKIVDFFIGSGDLSKYNYIFMEDIKENHLKLKSMGCTDDEISKMRDGDVLDVYNVLTAKNYRYVPYLGKFVKN